MPCEQFLVRFSLGRSEYRPSFYKGPRNPPAVDTTDFARSETSCGVAGAVVQQLVYSLMKQTAGTLELLGHCHRQMVRRYGKTETERSLLLSSSSEKTGMNPPVCQHALHSSPPNRFHVPKTALPDVSALAHQAFDFLYSGQHTASHTLWAASGLCTDWAIIPLLDPWSKALGMKLVLVVAVRQETLWQVRRGRGRLVVAMLHARVHHHVDTFTIGYILETNKASIS